MKTTSGVCDRVDGGQSRAGEGKVWGGGGVRGGVGTDRRLACQMRQTGPKWTKLKKKEHTELP